MAATNEKNRWIPLEANPEVFNSWAEQAGLVVKQTQFLDVYGLDEEMLSVIPRPVRAIILLFPDNEAIKNKHKEHDENLTKDGQYPIDETLFFVQQTIENACGTIALIHAIANSDVTYIPDSPLQRFVMDCKTKTPAERGAYLESTHLFTDIHIQASSLEQTVRQPVGDDDGVGDGVGDGDNDNNNNDDEDPLAMKTNLHFSCFVVAPDGHMRKEARERVIESSVGVPSGAVDVEAGTTTTTSTSTGIDTNTDINSVSTPAPESTTDGGTTVEAETQIGIGAVHLSEEDPSSSDPGQGQAENNQGGEAQEGIPVVPVVEKKPTGFRLIELDGRRPFPVDHGPCADLLNDVAEIVKNYYLSLTESVHFSMVALAAEPPRSSSYYPTAVH